MKNKNEAHTEKLCGAKTRHGSGTCKNKPMANGRCRMHGGKSTGAPPEKLKGNKNAVSTGEHEAIWMDALDANEIEIYSTIKTDPLEQINQELKLIEIRERRMMKRIQEVKRGAEENSVESRYGLVDGKMKETERTQKKRSKLDRILAIEEALTRVQDKKTKLLELKHKFLVDEAPPDEEPDDGFIDALKGTATQVWNDADHELVYDENAEDGTE